MSDDLELRVAALERRLAELEQQPARVPLSSSDQLWALDEVKRQAEGSGKVVYAGVATLPHGDTYHWQNGGEVASLIEIDWTIFADTIAALGHPVRLMLLRHIVQGRRTVGELQQLEALGTTGQLYHHLRQLVSAGWLRADGRGRYAVPVERVVPLLVVISVAETR